MLSKIVIRLSCAVLDRLMLSRIMLYAVLYLRMCMLDHPVKKSSFTEVSHVVSVSERLCCLMLPHVVVQHLPCRSYVLGHPLVPLSILCLS